MTTFFENIRLALSAIWANKGRAFLTMLGILIGVFVIIILIGIGQGIKKEVSKQVENLGSNLLVIVPGKFQKGEMPTGFIGESTLTLKDVETIKNVPGVQYVSPLMIVPAQVSDGNVIAQGAFVIGTNPEVKETMAGSLTEGEGEGQMFTEQDYQNKANVAVIFDGLKNQLFPDVSPIGKTVKLNNSDFTIIGYQKAKTTTTAFNQQSDFADLMLIPLTTAQELTKSDKVHRISVKVANAEEVDATKEQIKKDLLASHNNIEEFTVFTQEDLLSMFDEILSVLTNMLISLAVISLIVGGIGIMNIMLVSVTERTREIGLRKAVGASNFAILSQFLTEAIILSLLGGGVGIGLAKVVSLVISYKFNFEPVVDLYSVTVAFCFSLAIGIIFGVTPALRASRLKPIEALRYE